MKNRRVLPQLFYITIKIEIILDIFRDNIITISGQQKLKKKKNIHTYFDFSLQSQNKT